MDSSADNGLLPLTTSDYFQVMHGGVGKQQTKPKGCSFEGMMSTSKDNIPAIEPARRPGKI